METELQCIGCGSILQTERQDGLGYLPPTSLEKEHPMCQRCFKLRHYNKNEPVSLGSEDFTKIVSKIKGTKSLVVHVIDLFDVDGTLLKNLPRLVGNNPIVLVGNKVDLLPKSTNRRRLESWLAKKTRQAGLKVQKVFLVSAVKGHHFIELANAMEELRQRRDIYVVGVTNVGKSTFINRFIEQSIGEKEMITTSYFPGTTLGLIEIPLDDDSALIDTPGIINHQQISHFVSKKDLKMVSPKKEIKARNYQLNSAQTLFIAGLLRFDFIRGERQTFVCYFANELMIHRTKLENATNLYQTQVGRLFIPPSKETIKMLPPFVENTYQIEEPYTDIVISGLGWITVPKGDIAVKVHHPKGIAVHLRRSFTSKQ